MCLNALQFVGKTAITCFGRERATRLCLCEGDTRKSHWSCDVLHTLEHLGIGCKAKVFFNLLCQDSITTKILPRRIHVAAVYVSVPTRNSCLSWLFSVASFYLWNPVLSSRHSQHYCVEYFSFNYFDLILAHIYLMFDATVSVNEQGFCQAT